MSSNIIKILPIEYKTEIKYISSFSYEVLDFKINQYISFKIVIFDKNDTPLDIISLKISGDDYSQWKDDDNYVLNYIIRNLGFELS